MLSRTEFATLSCCNKQFIIEISAATVGSATLSHSHHAQVCHVDRTEVTLVADGGGNFGFGVDSAEYVSGGLSEPPFISYLEPGRVAER